MLRRIQDAVSAQKGLQEQAEAYRVLNGAALSAGEQLRARPMGQFAGFTQLRPKSTNDTTDCG